MLLPRIQAFELHELGRCPELVRETIVEGLGHALRWSRVYEAAAPVFAEFCEQAGATRVLDLCSGSGEPVSVLCEALLGAGITPPRFALSDLFPNLACMRRVASRHPGLIEVVPEPVDAASVPQTLDAPACTIVSAFHHFPPPLARSILADCVGHDRAVFVLEPCPRAPWRALAMGAAMPVAIAANPLLAERGRVPKALLTYLLPVLPVAAAFDSLVSLMRMYSEAELRSLVAPLGDRFEWCFRPLPVSLGGEVTAFFGVPRGPRPR